MPCPETARPNSLETAKAQSSFPCFTSDITAAIYNNGGFNNFPKTRGLWNDRLVYQTGIWMLLLFKVSKEKAKPGPMTRKTDGNSLTPIGHWAGMVLRPSSLLILMRLA